MSMNILRMTKTAPPKTPEREALAVAIERHNTAVRSFDATEKALDELRIHRAGGAVDRLQDARAAVETAKANAVTHLTAVALGEAGEPPMSVKDARLNLQVAEDELEAQQKTFEALQAARTNWDSQIRWSKSRLDDAIKDVVKSEPGIRNLLTKFEAAKAEMRKLRQELIWFDQRGMIPSDLKFWDATNFWAEAGPMLSERTAPWAGAIKELASNSEAPLPI
jgi:hypothetical protein